MILAIGMKELVSLILNQYPSCQNPLRVVRYISRNPLYPRFHHQAKEGRHRAKADHHLYPRGCSCRCPAAAQMWQRWRYSTVFEHNLHDCNIPYFGDRAVLDGRIRDVRDIHLDIECLDEDHEGLVGNGSHRTGVSGFISVSVLVDGFSFIIKEIPLILFVRSYSLRVSKKKFVTTFTPRKSTL